MNDNLKALSSIPAKTVPTFYEMPTTIRVYENVFYIDYEDKEIFSVANNVLSVTKIKNLKVEQSQKQKHLEALEILEPSVVIFLENAGPGHFHFMYEVLAEIEAILNFIPKAKIKIVNLGDELEFSELTNYLKEKGFFNAYNLNDEDIINLKNFSSLKIKEFFFINTAYNSVASKIANYQLNLGMEEDLNAWGSLFADSIRSRFVSQKPENKIFITRLNENDNYREVVKAMKKTIDKEELSEKEKSILSGRNISDYPELVGRLMLREEEILLEKMFRDAGYKIINPDKYGDIYGQSRLFNSAKYIAGLSGAAFINCCFCNSDAEVLVLNPSDVYTFVHDKIVESFGIKTYLCPKRMPWREEVRTAKEIFDAVKRNHPQFLDMI
jgi:hypothetical protein